MENSTGFLKNKNRATYDSAVPFMTVYPEKSKTGI